MNIFGKKEMKVLASLKNVEAKDITAEQIAAVNAELAEAGLIGIEANLFGSSNVASENIAAHEQAVSDLKAELQSSKDLAATHEATIAELTEKLAKTPAAAVEEVATGDDKITKKEGEESAEFDFNNSPSAKAMKEVFGSI
jgi:hypothetical protein